MAPELKRVKIMSKYQKYAEDENYIFPHRHCPVCNGVCPEDKQYCSDECRLKTIQKKKGSKKKTYIMIAVWGGVIAVFIILILLMQPPAP